MTAQCQKEAEKAYVAQKLRDTRNAATAQAAAVAAETAATEKHRMQGGRAAAPPGSFLNFSFWPRIIFELISYRHIQAVEPDCSCQLIH